MWGGADDGHVSSAGSVRRYSHPSRTRLGTAVFSLALLPFVLHCDDDLARAEARTVITQKKNLNLFLFPRLMERF